MLYGHGPVGFSGPDAVEANAQHCPHDNREGEERARVSDLRRYGAAYATLAEAQELSDLREALSGVEGALKDQDHIGVGAHARYVSEALERIAKR